MTHDGPEHGSVEETAGRLISLAEASELFGLSHSHLWKLVRKGKISAKQIGRYWVTTDDGAIDYMPLAVSCARSVPSISDTATNGGRLRPPHAHARSAQPPPDASSYLCYPILKTRWLLSPCADKSMGDHDALRF